MTNPEKKVSYDAEHLYVHNDNRAAFSAGNCAALDAYINGDGGYLREQFHNRAVALGLSEVEIAKLDREWRRSHELRRNRLREERNPKPPKREPEQEEPIEEPIDEPRPEPEEEEPEADDEAAKGQLVPVEPEPEEPEPETRPVFTPKEIIKLNRKHAVISNLGGKCVIMEFVPSSVTPGTSEPSYQTFKSFRERYLNQYVRDGISDKKLSVGQFWLAHERRRQYEGIDLVPDGDAVLPGNIFNLWRGWGVEPKKGDWSLLRRHVHEVLANGDQKFNDYIIRWGAWTFQHPGERTGAALVLRGGKGSGKGVWGDVFMTIFGEHALQIFDPTHLTGKHNAHLQNKLFLFADEAFWAGDKTAERTLKGVVTEKRMMIEPKGINAFPWPNRMSLYMAANEKWVVPASHDERRYAVSNVNERWKKNWTYFQPLLAEIAAGAPAAMLWDLQHMKLGDWDPMNNIPQTQALLEQKMFSLDGLEQWWVSLLDVGELPCADWKNPRRSNSEWLLAAAQKFSPRNRYVNETELGTFLRKMGCKAQIQRQKVGLDIPTTTRGPRHLVGALQRMGVPRTRP